MESLKAKYCLQEHNREQGHLYLTDPLTQPWPHRWAAVIYIKSQRSAVQDKVSAACVLWLLLCFGMA